MTRRQRHAVNSLNHQRSAEDRGKVVKRRRTTKAIGPTRLAIREAIQSKVASGRTRMTVDEIANLAQRKMLEMGTYNAQIGDLAYDQLKVVVRQELGRTTTADTKEFYSEGTGSHERTYVVSHVAQADTIRDNVAMRNSQVAALKQRLAKVEEILAYVEENNGTAEEAVFALYPEAEEQTVEDLLAALELVAAQEA